MASALSEPSPRWGHYSAAIGGQLHVFGGRTKDFRKEKSEIRASVHTFNQCVETWKVKITLGEPPPGLYDGACAIIHNKMYMYGGNDGTCFQDSLHQLDLDSFKWSQLLNGPMKKTGCRMASYSGNLILFGGYGIPSGPTQPGARFVKSTRSTDGRGWTNELHMFNVQEGEGV